MFDKEYSFRGTHADKVVKLTAKFDDKNSIFKRNLDVYMMAPIVGFLYQRRAESNNDGDQKPTKIFPEQLIGNKDDLAFNYRLIMLLDKNYEPELERRIDKAFRLYNTDEAAEDEKLFESYVLGGVDVLYEKIIGNASSAEGYMSNLYDFMEDMDERYNQTIDANRIDELCKLAKR
ncbi:hypothetical protein [Pseudobutyrivibrio sp. LB2011]|uniref:hypothetical protein n=1 Tax=Pseudobutyrivibrio sp. LB2011 TaxID=1408312 RepID=UPI0005D2049A|nr:hypothetical protein [Pseudobutyrivibrio sp. LB2011]